MINFETLEKLPGSMGNNITEVPPFLKDEPKPPTNGIENTVTMEDAIKTTDHTKISPLQPLGSPISGQTTTNASATLGSMLEAKMAIEMIDAVLPGLLVAAFHAFEIKMKKSELQLTEKEKTTVAPIFQKCLDTIYLNFNSPWTLLAVTVGIIYGGKVAEKGLVAYIDKQHDKKIEPVITVSKTEQIKTPEAELYNQADSVILSNIPKQEKPPAHKKWIVNDRRIKTFMKLRKVNREKAVRQLKILFAQGAPDPTDI